MYGKGEPPAGEGLADVVPLTRPLRRATLAAIIPSTRSLITAALLLAFGVLAYVAAKETSLFALRTLDVRGAGPAAADVDRVLAPLVGRSLVEVDVAGVERRLTALASVEGARLDRAFPHTLRVRVRSGRPTVVVRRGAAAWLVSATGRVLRPVPPRARPRLPRLWVDASTTVAPGAMVPDAALGPVRAAAALAARFPARVSFIRSGEDGLTFVLRSGFEVRLGEVGDLPLKVEIARRILPQLAPLGRGAYLDVSVPMRPVASAQSQVEG